MVKGLDGKPSVDAALIPVLDTEGRSLRGDEVRAAFPDLAGFVDPAVKAAVAGAQAQLAKVAKGAQRQIEAECDAAVQRLQLSLGHQGLPMKAIKAQLEAELGYYQSLSRALSKMQIELDSACGFVINR